MTYKFVVPTLDLNDFRATGANAHKQTTFLNNLESAYMRYGFCKIRGHKIVEKTKRELYEATVKFFTELDTQQKLKYKNPGRSNRGYKAIGDESAKYTNKPDLKEFFHVGRELSPEDLARLGYERNVWPDEISGLRAACLEAYAQFETTANEILEAFEMFLDLGRHYFKERTVNGNSVLRLIHYPPLEDDTINAVRAAEHEDINLITLLIGADAPGLEILTEDGIWIPINSREDELTVNTGDIMKWLTNERIGSTTHRVVNPEGDRRKKSRFSMPFFSHPLDSMDIGRGKTAGQFLQERLQEIYK